MPLLVVEKTAKDDAVGYAYNIIGVFGVFFSFFSPTHVLSRFFSLFSHYSPLLSSSSEGVVSLHGTSGYTGARIVRAPVVHRRWLTRPPPPRRVCDAAAAAAVADEPRSGSTFCNSRSPSKKTSSHRLIIIILCVCVCDKKIVSLGPMGSTKKKKKSGRRRG